MSKHDVVVKALKELAESYPNYSKDRIFPYLDKREPIKIPFHTFTYPYYPDLWTETKGRRVDVYEVWYTETEGEAIADIYLSAKVPNLLNLCIVCVKTSKDSWTEKDVENIIYTVLEDLEAKYPSLKSTIRDHVYVAEVGNEELKDKVKLKASLKKQFEF